MLKLLPCLLLLSLRAEAQKPSDSCAGSPTLASLSKGAGASLLRAYGFDIQQPWACTEIKSSWAAGATILRFRRITVQSDDHTAFTVVKIPTLEAVWVIPTEKGMLEVAHSESDPHNIAAFNALLGLHKGPINVAGWIEAGSLYMTLLGHREAVPIKDEADSCSEDECSLSFSDRPVVAGEAYNKWSLTFAAPHEGQPWTLTEVSRETVHP
jgi:hypothetical protein